MLAITPHHRLEREHIAYCIQSPFRLAFLNKTDQRIDHHHADDNAAVNPVINGRRYTGCRQQYINEDIMKLAEKTFERAATGCGCQLIDAVLR